MFGALYLKKVVFSALIEFKSALKCSMTLVSNDSTRYYYRNILWLTM